ncbi:MAG: peptide ABC transporter substrate-binding protein [Chloroflexota bacterium]|nr:peptide ABC transporter substrate-binding protein [Chloroflexota bacterium]
MADAQQSQGKFAALYSELKAGGLSRREFIERALALGVGMSVATFVANAAEVSARPGAPRAGHAFVAQSAAAGAPAAGMEGKTRGEGGELKLLQWQAPTTLNPHVSTGTKDYLAATIVLEPLMNYLPDGSIIPNLVTEVPTIENGMLAEDLKSVTFKLKEGVTWSDGEPFTAADVVFTRDWIMAEENASVSIGTWEPIATIEAVDDLTVKVGYETPNANWYAPFAGTSYGPILPKHILEVEGSADAFNANPIGTGPYVIDTFSPNDQVIYKINENYRDPNKPFFASVNLKGGGDAASAARAVLQTGEWDHAWNLQVEPAVIRDLEQGGKGKFHVVPGTSLERININFSDPNTEVEGQRSYFKQPHPFLTDKAVRQAMNLAADRDTIAKQFYGEGEPATPDMLNGLPAFDSPNTSYEFDLDKAKQILDDAGWTMDGDVRTKDGQELRITYATTINSVRQKTQQVIKQGFEKIGIKVNLQQIDSGIFFDSSPGNEQNTGHMYVDVNMYTNGPGTPTPTDYMFGWYAGPDGSNIAQKANRWSGQNFYRYQNPEYDKLYDQVRVETDVEKAAQIFIQMNDLLINDVALIPLVHRAADKYASSITLRDENLAISAFELNYWNIANWNRVEG